MMVLKKNDNHEFQKSVEHIGRIREGPDGRLFRCYVHLYALDVQAYPALFPLSIDRSGKVRTIVQNCYPTDRLSVELAAWNEEAVRILDEIFPRYDPPRFPTHFLNVGFYFKGKRKEDDRYEPFFKTFLSLSSGRKSPRVCGEQIAAFVFNRMESYISFEGELFFKEQSWVIDCLLAEWRLLRRR